MKNLSFQFVILLLIASLALIEARPHHLDVEVQQVAQDRFLNLPTLLFGSKSKEDSDEDYYMKRSYYPARPAPLPEIHLSLNIPKIPKKKIKIED